MASGHVNRIKRPNTWLHRPSLRREDFSCQPGAVHTWHETDVSPQSQDVRCWGMNGPSSDTARGPSLTQGGQTEENDSGPRSVELLRPFLVTSAIRQPHAAGSGCAPGDRLDNCSGGGTSIRLKLRSGMSLRAKPSNPGRVLCKPIKLTTSVPIAP